jgi:hypothetical protein
VSQTRLECLRIAAGRALYGETPEATLAAARQFEEWVIADEARLADPTPAQEAPKPIKLKVAPKPVDLPPIDI